MSFFSLQNPNRLLSIIVAALALTFAWTAVTTRSTSSCMKQGATKGRVTCACSPGGCGCCSNRGG